MEKKWKPVPDVEALRYKGTPEKPDIKIFVSHRIDLDSKIVDNPLYIPVRCGAVYDKREDVVMLGDDTGDNISEKRQSFCELTVLYWAWKNVKADYYGLCHYRRYISFADQDYRSKNDKSGFNVEPELTDESIEKYFLLDEEKMRNTICQYDLITTPHEDINYAWDGHHKSMYALCQNRVRDFDMQGVDSFIRIVKEKYPELSSATDSYFNNHFAKYYNCFIAKKQIFDDFCQKLFDVLFALEKELDTKNYNLWQTRMPGFMAENFFGIYYLYLKKQKKYSIIEKELEFFLESSANNVEEVLPMFEHNNIPIVFSASDYFAPYAAVFIQSIINTASPENCYDIIILQKSISTQNKERLLRMVERHDNISIRFYNPRGLLKSATFYINSAVQSEEAYYRIVTPYILKNYEKAIVLDCDLILKEDIANLYSIELGENLIGAAPDVVWFGHFNGATPALKDYCKEKFPIKNPYGYINTGVMLMNLTRWREEIDLQELLDFISANKFMIQEQDALNLLLENKVKYIDIAWNMYAYVAEYIKSAIDNCSPLWAKSLYYEAHAHPKIIHWAAQPKPWDVTDIDYAYEWWNLAKQTDYYELFIDRMITKKLGALHPAVLDLQNRMGIFDTRSGARKFADKLLPKGSKRREFAKILLPKGSLRWRFCKQIYYIFKPQYRPAK